jgi:hypothetical protein
VSMAPPHRTVDPARRAMPVAEWPEGDRVRWHRAQRPAEDVLDDGGPAAAWAPRTRDNVQSGVGRFLTWLRHTGRLGDGIRCSTICGPGRSWPTPRICLA